MPHAIYLDANATTPVMPEALAAADRVMRDDYGNPSSAHSDGLVAKNIRDTARRGAAALIGAGSGRMLFVSGATEGIQTAVVSGLCALRERRARGDMRSRLLVYGATEHKAVPESLAHWNRLLGLDLEIRALPVDGNGRHDLQQLQDWAPDIGMLCTMAANNETGVVSDLAGIGRVLDGCGSDALWLADCVQALGKLELNLAATRIDYAPFSGHKLYAPKGIGMLYVRAGSPYTALMTGGGQEDGARSGTENMPGIAALGAVLEALRRGDTFRSAPELQGLRAQLVQAVRDAFPAVVFNAPLDQTLPTTLNFSVPGLSSRLLLDLFDAAGIRISSGSACSAAKAAPSFVLEAMGLPAWRTTSAIRLSFGPLADDAFITRACAAIRHCGQVLRDAPAGSATPDVASDDTAELSATGTARASRARTRPETGHAIAADVPALDWRALEQLLHDEPQALLVDVRERYEHAADTRASRSGKAALNLPLTELERGVPSWLAGHPHPVVFFCRSGNRSLQAALAMQRQGHRACHHLAGGLALAGATYTAGPVQPRKDLTS